MNFFITGSTGFLGGEILTMLATQPGVDKIYCLVRADSFDSGLERLRKVFAVHNDHFDPSRIIPVCGDMTDENLIEQLSANKDLQSVEIIIHSAANTSFAKIYDNMIEKVNIQGLTRIAKWSATLPNLKTFNYIGTATIIGKGAVNRVVYEDESPNPDSKHFVKYTYSKMMGEVILRETLPAEKILVTRPSIIAGDTRDVTPRSYVILWSLAAMNMLRLNPVLADAIIDMIPVDYAAKAIVSLVLSTRRKYNVYHVSAGTGSSTHPTELQDSIMREFPDAPPFKFLQRHMINQMKQWARGKLDPTAELNQYSEYLDYWERTFSDRKQVRILFGGLEPYYEFMSLGQVFDNSRLLEDTDVGLPEPIHKYLPRHTEWLRDIDVMDGAINNKF